MNSRDRIKRDTWTSYGMTLRECNRSGSLIQINKKPRMNLHSCTEFCDRTRVDGRSSEKRYTRHTSID